MATSTITTLCMIILLITLELISKADCMPPIALNPTDRNLQSQKPPSTFPPLVRDLNTTSSTIPSLEDRHKDDVPLKPALANDPPTTSYSTQDHTSPISHVEKPSSGGMPSQLDHVIDHTTTTSTFPPLIHDHIPSTGVDKYKPMESPIPAAVSDQQPIAGPCSTAIIGCCSPISPLRQSVDQCLRLLGCRGPFWDLPPCSSGVLKEAFKIAAQFYEDSKL